MSKHVHPTLFRRGHPSHLNKDFIDSVSRRGVELFERQDRYIMPANIKRGGLGRSIQWVHHLEKILQEFFQKSGYLIEFMNVRLANGTLTVNIYVYHRVLTSPVMENPKSKISQDFASKHSQKRARRIMWTTRALPWRRLRREDLHFFKSFFEKYLYQSRAGLKANQIIWNMQQFSFNDSATSPYYKILLLALQSVQNQGFFQDTLAILCRAAEEPSAELLAQLLRAELGQLRNQQVMLDTVSQGLQLMVQLERSTLKACLIKVRGRINGSDRAKIFQFRKGSMPLHTLDAAIDYSVAEVNTKYGILNIKVYLKYLLGVMGMNKLR